MNNPPKGRIPKAGWIKYCLRIPLYLRDYRQNPPTAGDIYTHLLFTVHPSGMLKKKHQQEGSTVAAATSTATADPVIPLLSTICWKDHPEWTDQLIASLLQHPNIRL